MELVRVILAKDHRLIIKMIVKETCLDINADYRTITKVLRKNNTKIVPKNLSLGQKVNRLTIGQDY